MKSWYLHHGAIRSKHSFSSRQRIHVENRRNSTENKETIIKQTKDKSNNDGSIKENHRESKDERSSMLGQNIEKELPEEYIYERLQKLFNYILEEHRYPEEWKQTEIIMISN